MRILNKFVFSIVLISAALGLSTNALASATQNIQELQAMAQAGDANAQNSLGKLYATGNGVKVNEKQAFYWFNKAAKQGNVAAIGNLGDFYLRGRGGVSVDFNKAFKMIGFAAAHGIVAAKNNMGLIYDNGYGVPVNHQLAFKYFLSAAQSGSKQAQFNLGYWYLREKSTYKSFSWYQKSALNGFPQAIRQLGFMYEFGVGTNKSYPQAYKWFSLGAAKGDKVSQNALQQLEKKMTPAQIAEGKKLVAAHQSQS